MRLNQKKWFIGISILFGTVVLISTMSLSQNTVSFYNRRRLCSNLLDFLKEWSRLEALSSLVQLNGNPKMSDLHLCSPTKKDIVIEVTHIGSPPDLFKEGQGVIAEGKLSNDGLTMRARTLMETLEEKSCSGEALKSTAWKCYSGRS